MNFSRLVLGTAQLGSPYGLSNTTGQPDRLSARLLIEAAWSGGIREFDTAQAYGKSEQVLGRALRDLGIHQQALVIGKLAPDLDLIDRSAVQEAVQSMLKNLGCATLHGLMLHRERQIDLWEQGLGETLQALVVNGLVQRIGVSVYTPEYALKALAAQGVGIIQIPSNVLDRRFEKAGVFQAAHAQGVLLYVRSVFLQGLLLLKPDHLPEHLRFCAPYLQAAEALAKSFDLDRSSFPLGFAKQAYPEAKIIFGAENSRQVQGNLTGWARHYPEKLVEKTRETFDTVPETVCNPTLWPTPAMNTAAKDAYAQ